MSSAAEAKLLPVLDAMQRALRKGDWSDPAYEAAMDALLDAKDAASLEAKVALMDYATPSAYSSQLSCVVSTGGKKALHYLELYSRCDIAPSRSPVPRDHSSTLRSLTLQAWKATHGKGSCNFE